MLVGLSETCSRGEGGGAAAFDLSGDSDVKITGPALLSGVFLFSNARETSAPQDLPHAAGVIFSLWPRRRRCT